MDKLRALEVFVRIVESGSLTGAASDLGLSVPAVVRSLAALERKTGVRLLNRTTRRSSLTDEGREYYVRGKNVLAELAAADAVLSARRAEPRGRLRLTAPVVFGRLHVAPIVRQFIRRYPDVQVELLLYDRIVDLVEEGIDAGIRIAQLADSSLVAVPVGETRRIVCASPDYLKKAGVPNAPAAIATHASAIFTGLGASHEWEFAGASPARVATRGILRSNQFDVVRDACVGGLGLARFLCYQVRAELASGILIRVLSAYEPAAQPIQIVYPSARLMSPNVRAFVDLAARELRAVAAQGSPAHALGVPQRPGRRAS